MNKQSLINEFLKLSPIEQRKLIKELQLATDNISDTLELGLDSIREVRFSEKPHCHIVRARI